MQSSETEDRWYVNVGGTPKMMTLDQLVEAFEAGVINSKTLVTEVGGTEWKPLSEVADLGDEEEEAAPQSVGRPPVLAPIPARAAPSYPPAVARATQSGWPPAVAASQPPSMAPVARSLAPSAPISMAPVSTMPVVQDLSFGLDDDFKPRRSKAPYVAAAAVLLLVGGVVSATTLGGGGELARPVAVPAAAPVAAPTLNAATTTTTPAEPAPTPAPAPAATTEGSSEKTATSETRLDEAVKSKLKEADKTRADKKKSAKASRGRAPARSKSGGSKDVFRAGGDASDPLNSTL
jgi:hypothetical protein